MYILLTVWFPARISIEVGKKALEINEKLPDDETILKTVLDGGLMRTKNGIKGIAVWEVMEGKFEEAYSRVGEILALYAEVDGLNGRMDVMTTAAEAMESIGLAIPA
ncbi:MAG: hypothetical protein ACXAEX_03770 [Promethearchaeota archaeon]|jgi:hypothetical protein